MKAQSRQYADIRQEADQLCWQEIANDPGKLRYWQEIAEVWKESLRHRRYDQARLGNRH